MIPTFSIHLERLHTCSTMLALGLGWDQNTQKSAFQVENTGGISPIDFEKEIPWDFASRPPTISWREPSENNSAIPEENNCESKATAQDFQIRIASNHFRENTLFRNTDSYISEEIFVSGDNCAEFSGWCQHSTCLYQQFFILQRIDHRLISQLLQLTTLVHKGAQLENNHY